MHFGRSDPNLFDMSCKSLIINECCPKLTLPVNLKKGPKRIWIKDYSDLHKQKTAYKLVNLPDSYEYCRAY